jgi:hypothetical protein
MSRAPAKDRTTKRRRTPSRAVSASKPAQLTAREVIYVQRTLRRALGLPMKEQHDG